MADMTPGEIAAYRDSVLSAQGLTNDGTGNYYDQSYYDARPAALAANNVNTAATNNSGLFGGVQNVAAQDAVRASAGQAPGAFMATPVATPTVAQTAPATSALQTYAAPASKFDPNQISTIKGVWDKYTKGQYTPQEMYGMMAQYNVGYQDIADVIGAGVGDVISKLQLPSSNTTNQYITNPATPYAPTNFLTSNTDNTESGGALSQTYNYGGNLASTKSQPLVPSQWKTPLASQLYADKLGALTQTVK